MKTLRDYQQVAVDRIVKRHRIILADERGLGKTATTLTAIQQLVPTAVAARSQVLVLAPSTALGVWQEETREWLGSNYRTLLYSGESNPRKRDEIWRKNSENPAYLVVATYAMVKELVKRQRGWQAIVCDEYHIAGLMNPKSTTFKAIKQLHCRFFLPLSGTPIRRGPQDLFGPLHLVDPTRFPSYWDFVEEHCITIPTAYGDSIEPRPRDPEAFRQMVQPYIIHRTKTKVLHDLPPKTRQPIPITMTPTQARLYNEMEKDLMISGNGTEGLTIAPSHAVKLLRQRQLLVTPQILGYPEVGAAIPALVADIEAEFAVGRSVAVCTPFKAGIPFIVAAIKKNTETQDATIYVIHGGAKTPSREVAAQFQSDKRAQKILVYTIASGMSWNAFGASTGFFVGYDWSALANLQAEDRLHRMGQRLPVHIYYYMHRDTVDDLVMDKLDDKTMAANWVLRTEELLQALRTRATPTGR